MNIPFCTWALIITVLLLFSSLQGIAQPPFNRDRIAIGVAPVFWSGNAACKLCKEASFQNGYGVEFTSGVLLDNRWSILFNNILLQQGLRQIPYLPDNSIYDKEPITRYIFNMDIQRYHPRLPLMLGAGLGGWFYYNGNRYKPQPGEPFYDWQQINITAKGLNTNLKAGYVLHQGEWFSQMVFLNFHYTYITQWQARELRGIVPFKDRYNTWQLNAGVNVELHRIPFPQRIPNL